MVCSDSVFVMCVRVNFDNLGAGSSITKIERNALKRDEIGPTVRSIYRS